MSSRLVLVSNRVPAPRTGDLPGGLVSALTPVFRRQETALWFGWSGEVTDGAASTRLHHDLGTSYLTTDLTTDEFAGYYQAFSNEVLWPALHGFPDRVRIPEGSLGTYRAVNARFASILAPHLTPDDVVWVHDYHLIPLGEELRRRGFGGRLGYFLHIPVPEDWAAIEGHQALLRSFEAYDLIGVQTDADGARLRASLPRSARPRVRAFPISINPEEVRASLDHASDAGPAGAFTFFGVDRLDYTKGIPHRLEAYRHVLERRPDIRSARFVQWSAPSRADLSDYREERLLVETAADRVRAVGGDALLASYESRPRAEVLRMLAEADVCVVTSLADGMNLVAKEYAAVHSAERPGVLILSDAAGAAEEFAADALVFPAGDAEALARHLEAAFDMTGEERRRRAAGLRAQVDAHTSDEWARDFLEALRGVEVLARSTAVVLPVRSHRGADQRLRQRTEARLRALQDAHAIERLWARDHTLWSPGPDEIADRLGWLDVDARMRAELPRLKRFAESVARDGFTSVLVLGMGGSAMAPRVYAAAAEGRGLRLHVLDSTVPDAIRAVEQGVDLERTLFIVSSKSGTTAETAHLLEHFWHRRPDGRRFVAITDPGSPLHALASERGFREVFLNPSDIGGRFSALSLYGLVPAVLAGLDTGTLLDGAERMRRACGPHVPAWQHPGARLGATLAEAALMGRDVLALSGDRETAPFDGWIEQLVAESTGKDRKGILPVLNSPALNAESGLVVPEMLDVRLLEEIAGTPSDLDGAFALGGRFYQWEVGVALAGAVLALNPFDQPDVESTKAATRALLEPGAAAPDPLVEFGDLLTPREDADYIAIHAYLGGSEAEVERLQRAREQVERATGVPATLEYGPSFLHATGQYHKAGRRRGAFLQVLPASAAPLEAAGQPYTFDDFTGAQAGADRAVLEDRGAPVAQGTLSDLERVL